MLKHENFEQLCTLSAVGQLSAEEYLEFGRHLSDCASCRKRLEETCLLAEALPAAERMSNHRSADFFLPPSPKAFRDNFIARARREGISLTAQSDRMPSFFASWPFHTIRLYHGPLAATVAVLVVAGLFLAHNVAKSQLQPQIQIADARIAELTQKVSSLQKKSTIEAEKLTDTQQAADTLASQHREDSQKVAALQKLLVDTKKQVDELQTSLMAAQIGQKELAQKLTDGNRELEQVRAELANATSARQEDHALLTAERQKADELSEQLRLQAAGSDRERQLLTADRDIRDLMGARDLHIIDVHDFDAKGKRRRSFGRIFLTENKSLIFYAFDLADPKIKNASFQAWGKREGDEKEAVSLGIFYTDDKDQSRWVLKFDNPDILREIDSVFVTIEPHGGGKRPRGQKLLYAYLNTDANHP